MATLEQIQARLDKLQAQADDIRKQSSAIVEKIRGLMAKHGLTTADIDAHVGSKKRGPQANAKAAVTIATSAAKYRDPKTGATWSGHGGAPAWIATAKNRDKFLVDASTATVNSSPTTKAKAAGNYARGPQPAMYRDPKSGATWSGRGRAPNWISEAKSRDKFLISDAADATVGATASAAGVASKAKTVVEKTSKAVGATAGKRQPKGAQAAKYLEPKTGAMWSGRGRASAWLAGAKDRSKFLIGGVAEVSAESEAKAPKKVIAGKSATKTAGVRTTVAKKIAGGKVAAKNSTDATVKKAPVKRAAAKRTSGKKPSANPVVNAASQAVEAPNIATAAEA